jgi:hypothetical protein
MKANATQQAISNRFKSEKILDLTALKETSGSSSRMTIFRHLKTIGYYTSYSHKGKFYTLQSIPSFDLLGLWHFHGIHFSRHGNLLTTVVELIKGAEAGYFADELEQMLQVFVYNALGRLFVMGRLCREQIDHKYLYLSPTASSHQLAERKQRMMLLATKEVESDGLNVGGCEEQFNLFLSVLNEKQKRLYLGFESLRYGHGGDVQMARMTGVDVKTIARGRRELSAREVDMTRVRRAGAGRPPLKKKTSSSSSKP